MPEQIGPVKYPKSNLVFDTHGTDNTNCIHKIGRIGLLAYT